MIPTEKGFSILIDCGANVDARPSHLVQFAKMGSIYMEHIMGVKNPKVAIVNIGAEEEKGNALVKETFPMLKECKDINFIGSIEAREIPHGQADVIVCEAFTGNVILKLYEGVASVLVSKIKGGMKQNLRGMIGGLLVKPVLKKTMKDFDASEYGGAPLLLKRAGRSRGQRGHYPAGPKAFCGKTPDDGRLSRSPGHRILLWCFRSKGPHSDAWKNHCNSPQRHRMLRRSA